MQVDFIIAGAQKSGTTALEQYVSEHPGICVPRAKKELHFFDRDRNFTMQPVDYGRYHAFFEPLPSHRLLGEATPGYLYCPAAPERMAAYNSALKLIIVLRNPVTRAFSQWNMARQIGREPLPFLDAIKEEPERARSLPPQVAARFAYVDRGFYARQLKRLWRYFPREQTAIFRSEALLESPNTVLLRIAEFLDITPFPEVAPRIVHAAHYDTTISDEARHYLIDVFESEIRELEHLLGWDCSRWVA